MQHRTTAVLVTATTMLLPLTVGSTAEATTRARTAPTSVTAAPALSLATTSLAGAELKTVRVTARKKRPPGPRVYERRVVRRTNEARRAHGRKGVKRAKCLNRYAQRSANRIAANRRLTHQNLKPVLRRCGGWKVGENIAYGFNWPIRVVRAWMDSPGHRANILERRYRRIGVGVRRDANGTVWVSQVFAYRR